MTPPTGQRLRVLRQCPAISGQFRAPADDPERRGVHRLRLHHQYVRQRADHSARRGTIPIYSGGAAWSNFNVCSPQPMDAVEATMERGRTLDRSLPSEVAPHREHLRVQSSSVVIASRHSVNPRI